MTDFSSLNVVVLAGGMSHERDISLRSGRRLADALTRVGHTVTVREPDPTFLSSIADTPPDVVWPALHGASGEDGGLRALLELSRIPFVGSSAASARLAWSKPTAKTLVQRIGLPTPDSLTLAKETFQELGAAHVLTTIVNAIGLPLVVKPTHGGSAQGVSIVTEGADLPRAIVEAYTYCDVALVERHVTGTEVAVGIIDTGDGPEILPIVEIEPVDGTYSFEARYNAGETFFYVPARLSDQESRSVIEAAHKIYDALALRHISRLDFIIDAHGTPWFLEANVLPGLTETSLLPQSIEAAQLQLGDVYSRLAIAAIRDSTTQQ